MHPIDSLADPLSVLALVVFVGLLTWALYDAFRDERAHRRDVEPWSRWQMARRAFARACGLDTPPQ